MFIFVTVVHVLLCVFMILVILLQPGKDAGMGAAFGGGAATSAFGGRGAVTFLSKMTAVFAGLFFVTSLGLSFAGVGSSVADRVPTRSAPAAAPSTIETPIQPEGAVGVPVEPGVIPGAGDIVPHNVPPPRPAQELDVPAPAAPGPSQ